MFEQLEKVPSAERERRLAELSPVQRRDMMGNHFADKLAVRARERCPRNVFDFGLASEREAVRRKTTAIARVISTMLTLWPPYKEKGIK